MCLDGDLLERLRAYKSVHQSWGRLHIIFDDKNFEDEFVWQCLEYAQDYGDVAGVQLAFDLLPLTWDERNELVVLCS